MSGVKGMAEKCGDATLAVIFLGCLAAADWGIACALVSLLGLCDMASKTSTIPKCFELQIADSTENPMYYDKWGAWCNLLKTEQPGNYIADVDLPKFLDQIVRKVGNLTTCPSEHSTSSYLPIGDSGKCPVGHVETRYYLSDQTITRNDECVNNERMRMWLIVGCVSIVCVASATPFLLNCFNQKKTSRRGIRDRLIDERESVVSTVSGSVYYGSSL